jgi:hypothetical protein
VRSGIALPLGTRLEINLALEIGAVAETVSVVAQAPLLDTNSVSSGQLLDNRGVMDLPVIANNTMVMVKLTPGVQTSGVNDYLGPHSISGASDFSIAAGVGGNEWTIDGVPNNGASRQTAYLPHADTVQEVKVETANFDASVGHSTGVYVTMMTKTGTNQFHGTLTEQHWQNRWQGTAFFAKQLYYRNIALAEAAGDHAKAEELRHRDKQDPGRSNNYAGTIGGPVRIPKLFNGKDRLFFFFNYQGNKDQVADLPTRINNTIPTLDDRTGDFSRFLKVNAPYYQIYDPLTVRTDPARAGHFVRTPFPGNILPSSRMVNPTYNFYSKILPTPNNDFDSSREPLNNFLSNAPLVRDYKAYGSRIDFHASSKHRFFGRWTYNDWVNDADDWTYTTLRGLSSLRQSRTNLGATVDWVYTLSATTMLNAAVAVNDYRDGNKLQVPTQYKPSDVGLPKYMDDKAGDQHIMPTMNFSGYRSISRGYAAYTHYRALATKADLTHIHGSHTLRTGFDGRGQFRTGGGGGNTSGSFSFDNSFTRRNDDNFTPAGNLAHSWAAFYMGLPSSMSVATNDSYAMLNPYYAVYVQDQWRLTKRLSLNLGLRMEYEMGPTERYNRAISYFDPSAELPITSAAQAAYAKAPVPELAAPDFVVKGGSLYAGSNGAPRKLWQNELMWLPRVAFAYQANSKTVVRGGYGLFYDTINVLNGGPDQSGYSRTTSTTVTTDFGTTWLVGNPLNGVSPLTDPFPVRSDGTRFDAPTNDRLGLMARAGRGWSFNDYHVKHAREQRWRIGVQHQIGSTMVVDVAYTGTYSDRIPIGHSLSPLPAQYWASGTVRNDAVANNMNANVTNPFRLTNFTALESSNPLVYRDMSTLGFYTSATIRKNQLLRAYPQMNGLTMSNASLAEARTHALEVTFQKRFSKGFNLNLGYTRMQARTADYFNAEFDAAPTWRTTNDGRPHRLVASGIYEFPFGKGRAFAKHGPLSWVFGGFQAAATYEFQPGPLLDWGNIFYYGNLGDISSGQRTLDRWFNTANFERTTSKMPAAYQLRVFPTRVDGVRADMTNQWNVNLQRDFRIREKVSFQVRMDALNLQNRSQFAAPVVNPSSTDFGRVTSQTNTRNRFLQLQGRLRF